MFLDGAPGRRPQRRHRLPPVARARVRRLGAAGQVRARVLEKAQLFEVALPPVPGGRESGAVAASSAAATVVAKDEAAGVGLAIYARVFAREVA